MPNVLVTCCPLLSASNRAAEKIFLDELVGEFANQEILLATCIAGSLPHSARKLGVPKSVLRDRLHIAPEVLALRRHSMEQRRAGSLADWGGRWEIVDAVTRCLLCLHEAAMVP